MNKEQQQKNNKSHRKGKEKHELIPSYPAFWEEKRELNSISLCHLD